MKSIFSKILYVLVLLAVSLPAMAQRNVITGVVYDESGLPLTGASVIVEGTNRGVTTRPIRMENTGSKLRPKRR